MRPPPPRPHIFIPSSEPKKRGEGFHPLRMEPAGWSEPAPQGQAMLSREAILIMKYEINTVQDYPTLTIPPASALRPVWFLADHFKAVRFTAYLAYYCEMVSPCFDCKRGLSTLTYEDIARYP